MRKKIWNSSNQLRKLNRKRTQSFCHLWKSNGTQEIKKEVKDEIQTNLFRISHCWKIRMKKKKIQTEKVYFVVVVEVGSVSNTAIYLIKYFLQHWMKWKYRNSPISSFGYGYVIVLYFLGEALFKCESIKSICVQLNVYEFKTGNKLISRLS